MIANDVLELVGNTPLVRMDFLGKNYATVLAKLEYFNPSGSVKDRTAKYLIEYAEASGKIDKNKEILEASSGNFGVSLAMIAAVKGYKVTIVLPKNSSLIKKRLIEAFGGKVIFSPADKGTAGAIELKKKLLKKYPKRYIDINQFENPANILAHYYTTGKELIEQTHGKIDMIIARISFLKQIKTATKVPACTFIVNARAPSFKPKIFWKITRWPELLTGRNSVSPCIIPSMIA